MKILFLNYTKKNISKARVLKLCQKLARNFSKHPVLKKKLSKVPGIDDLSIVFVSPKLSQWLNKKFRNKNRPTDVLSFAPREMAMGLGELVLCNSVLQKQAREHKHSFQKEVDLMVIHGFLHLLGYDHEKSLKEERQMMKIQEKLFNKFS